MNVLIADDEKNFRVLLKKILPDSIFTIEHEKGDTALLDIKYHMGTPNQYDLILLDISMPGMNGIQVLRERRKKQRDSIHRSIKNNFNHRRYSPRYSL